MSGDVWRVRTLDNNVTGIPCVVRGFRTFLEMSAEFEIGGRFSGRHLDPEVSLSPPHTRL